MIVLLCVLALVSVCLGGATNPTIAPPNTVAMVSDEPGVNPTSCHAPGLYVIGQNNRANQMAGMWYTFDDPAAPTARWTSAMHSRHSTCRFKFNGNNDDNSAGVADANNVNCGPVTGNCRRCRVTAPCLCSRMTQDQQDFQLHYRYIWQDNDGVLEESDVQGPVTVKVSRQGKPGCPIDWSQGNVMEQYNAIPAWNQLEQ